MEKEIVITKDFIKIPDKFIFTGFKIIVPEPLFISCRRSKSELILYTDTLRRVSLLIKKKNIRSVILVPYNRIYYRIKTKKIEILCLFDMRRDPEDRPY